MERPTNDAVWTFSRPCFNRPKGEERTAQGFSPGNVYVKGSALKGRPTAGRYSQKMRSSKATRFGRPFRAISLCVWFPGLKPWAILCSPFGRWRNVQTPVPGLKPWAVLFSPFGPCQMSKLHWVSFAMPPAWGVQAVPLQKSRQLSKKVSTKMRPAAGGKALPGNVNFELIHEGILYRSGTRSR